MVYPGPRPSKCPAPLACAFAAWLLCGGLAHAQEMPAPPELPPPTLPAPPEGLDEKLAAKQPVIEEGELLMRDVPPRSLRDWRTGERLFTAGTVIGLVGSGVTIAGGIAGGIAGTDSPITQSLVYGGAALNGTSVILTSTGLGLKHRALDLVGRDPGRLFYGIGTTLNMLGLVVIGVSFGLTGSNALSGLGPEYQSVPVFTAAAGSGLMLLGSLVYVLDLKRVGKAWATIKNP